MQSIFAELSSSGMPNQAGQRMTKADFLAWQSDDARRYEFADGWLLLTTTMRPDEVFLHTNLENQFFLTDAFRQGSRLKAELDIWLTDNQMRRPDMAVYTANQLALMRVGQRTTPAFVVELLSINDEVQKDLLKIRDYFAAGVQVIWWIYPTLRLVYVYTDPKTVRIATDGDTITATPVIPDLTMDVCDLFS